MPVEPVKPIVEPAKGVLHIIGGQEYPEVNIERAGFTLVGNAHDIARVEAACKKALEQAAKASDPDSIMRVKIRAPQEDEL